MCLIRRASLRLRTKRDGDKTGMTMNLLSLFVLGCLKFYKYFRISFLVELGSGENL